MNTSSSDGVHSRGASPRPDSGTGQLDVWVAVLEFAPADPAAPFPEASIKALVRHLAVWRPSGLWSPDRYAIQVQLPARAPHLALRWALDYHREAAHDIGLPATTLVRAEILTVEQLDRSWQECDLDRTLVPRDAPRSLLPDQLYEATRRLVAATTEAQVITVVDGFVRAAGGRVVDGAPPDQRDTTHVDMSIGYRRRYAAADALSVPGLIIEQVLPTLVGDARRALSRLLVEPRDQPPAATHSA